MFSLYILIPTRISKINILFYTFIVNHGSKYIRVFKNDKGIFGYFLPQKSQFTINYLLL